MTPWASPSTDEMGRGYSAPGAIYEARLGRRAPQTFATSVADGPSLLALSLTIAAALSPKDS